MSVNDPSPAPLARDWRGCCAAAAALRPPGGARGARHRRLAALGALRGPARPAPRGGGRPRPSDDPNRRRASGLPAGKTLEAWDEAASAIPKPTQQALCTLEWVERAETLCVCGPSGTGKSHFVEALGHLAIERGKTVAWHTLESLGALIASHRADQLRLQGDRQADPRRSVVILTTSGLLPVSPEAAEALFRVVDATYERRSMAITSNIHPAGFDELMPNTLAAATVDRLLHHAHVLVTDGSESYRLAQATDGKGVMPLGLTTAHGAPCCATAYGLRSDGSITQPVGRTDGHEWGEKMSASGEVRWPPVGRNRWPLTPPRRTATALRRRSGVRISPQPTP